MNNRSDSTLFMTSRKGAFVELEGMKILVTGGANGIGAATVRRYAKEGALVTSVDVDDENGIKVADEANENAQDPGKAIYRHCDISLKDEVDTVFAQAKEEMGGFDMLAQIAAKPAIMKPAADYTLDDISFMWNNDITATLLTNQAACRIMQEYNKGIIVNFGSEESIHGVPGNGLYCSAKAAVATWTRSIAKEWGAKYNIHLHIDSGAPA